MCKRNRPYNIPSVSTPHGLYYSQGLKGKRVEFSTVCHSRFLFCQMTRIPHAGWPQAAWLPSFSLWHKMPAFGKWLPLAPPHGKSSSQSQQRSELIHLKQNNFMFSLYLQGSLYKLPHSAYCCNALHAASNVLPSKTSTDANRNRITMSKSNREMHRCNRSKRASTIWRFSQN